jgi:hypothetical protein
LLRLRPGQQVQQRCCQQARQATGQQQVRQRIAQQRTAAFQRMARRQVDQVQGHVQGQHECRRLRCHPEDAVAAELLGCQGAHQQRRQQHLRHVVR